MENWIFPCNIKFFNITEYLKNHSTIVWKKDRNTQIGDTVYLYLGSPFSQIKYRARVLSDEVTSSVLADNTYAIPAKSKPHQKYVILEIIKEYPSGDLSLAKLRKYGLGQVQTQARIDRKLRKYLEQCEADQNG